MPQNRGRAWRRAQKIRTGSDRHGPRTRGFRWGDPYPKRWYEVALRHNKLHRARQIGLIWPRQEWVKLMADADPVRILFICSFNKWRSPTGERVFKNWQGVETRSAGTSRSARRKVRLADIKWADLIFVMEDKHKERLRADFRQDVRHKDIHVLDIPDDYQLMDQELVSIFEQKVPPFLKGHE